METIPPDDLGAIIQQNKNLEMLLITFLLQLFLQHGDKKQLFNRTGKTVPYRPRPCWLNILKRKWKTLLWVSIYTMDHIKHFSFKSTLSVVVFENIK